MASDVVDSRNHELLGISIAAVGLAAMRLMPASHSSRRPVRVTPRIGDGVGARPDPRSPFAPRALTHVPQMAVVIMCGPAHSGLAGPNPGALMCGRCAVGPRVGEEGTAPLDVRLLTP